MKKTILIITALLTIFVVYQSTIIKIPDSAIRFRILANSNSVYDQKVKEDIKNVLQQELYSLLKDTKSINDARSLIKGNISHFERVLSDNMKDVGYSYKIDYGMHLFPAKTYKGTTYDEGYYESLLVTLGEGKGDNWWCVLFPPMCMMEAEETNTNEVEYKSYFVELFKNIFKRK